jgi:hypothetical protein
MCQSVNSPLHQGETQPYVDRNRCSTYICVDRESRIRVGHNIWMDRSLPENVAEYCSVSLLLERALCDRVVAQVSTNSLNRM